MKNIDTDLIEMKKKNNTYQNIIVFGFKKIVIFRLICLKCYLLFRIGVLFIFKELVKIIIIMTKNVII